MDKQALDRAQGHRRRNPLTGDWILVSPNRLERPWQGAEEEPTAIDQASYDPNCYLCPGNVRNSGEVNATYDDVFVFDNDYPALVDFRTQQESTSASAGQPDDPLFAWHPESGVCRVVCFSPHHSQTLSDLTDLQLGQLIEVWCEQSEELGERFPYGSVQVFENKGAQMGCSNPHPHNQIWAQAELSTVLRKEIECQATYRSEHDKPMLEDYMRAELRHEDRLVCENTSFVVVVPFWAVWPFETLLLPKRHISRLPQLTPQERQDFGEVLGQLSRRYDRLFNVSFPYSAGVHQAPASGDFDDVFTLHMHFYPPLLRSATVRKFLVGFEMLAEAQRDMSPEAAAAVLRGLDATRE